MSFFSEKTVKAVRKRRACVACSQWIEISESAVNWTGLVDGEFSSVYYHPECRDAEVALNDLIDYRLGDDWLPLYEAERDNYPWLHREHPLTYKRLIMTREQWAAAITKANGD